MTVDDRTLESFILTLREAPERRDVFNPWWHSDRENDADDRAPEIRRRQLFYYLKERIPGASTILVGEALGYQGGHFTGIPMTSERIILGKMIDRGILPDHVFRTIKPERTSRPDLKPDGFSEPTATIVWGTIIEMKLDPFDFILWNAFPWHPFDLSKGILSNRTAGAQELAAGAAILEVLLGLVKARRIFALGNKAEKQLRGIGVDGVKLRHPANAGGAEFRKSLSLYLKGRRLSR